MNCILRSSFLDGARRCSRAWISLSSATAWRNPLPQTSRHTSCLGGRRKNRHTFCGFVTAFPFAFLNHAPLAPALQENRPEDELDVKGDGRAAGEKATNSIMAQTRERKRIEFQQEKSSLVGLRSRRTDLKLCREFSVRSRSATQKSWRQETRPMGWINNPATIALAQRWKLIQGSDVLVGSHALGEPQCRG